MRNALLLGLALAGTAGNLFAQDSAEVLKLPAIFGSHMVLQRDMEVPIWGWDRPGQVVEVSLRSVNSDARPETVKGTAGADGRWEVRLSAHSAGGPWKIQIKGSGDVRTLDDVLFGEVWICSGQSNMALPLDRADDADLERRTAKFPNIRFISVPQVGTQEPQTDFNGKWDVCTPETVGQFSAVGYLFGRQLHETLDVPVGLIDNAWGGSACEAWIRRDLLEKDARFAGLMARWKQTEANVEKAMVSYNKQMAAWREAAAAAKKAGKPQPRRPGRSPQAALTGNQRPANIYNGVLKPTIGYGIRGAIWYQGESNANRAYQYRELFPYMIQTWREEWGQGDFPFYWVQLADFRNESTEPTDSAWAELREAQTMTMQRLPNTGQAVIIDIGEGRDIHPRNKQGVARRLARWALAKDYGHEVVHQSPTWVSMEKEGNRVTLTFDHVGQGLYTFDVNRPLGFTIAGSDKKFHNASAQLKGKNQIVVWSDSVAEPVAVRYAWADNPICNVYSRDGLPATPFRTDDWKGITADNQ